MTPTPPPASGPTSAKTTSARFGKYRLIALLGRGGMADVFLGVLDGPAGFTKLTVVKRMRETIRESPEFITMFVDEARIASRLNSPNVVQTNEVGEVDGQYYLAMEYLDGQPLHRLWHKAKQVGTKITPAVNVLILVETLKGLHYAHELKDYDGAPMNVVHRDVTPQNIFVTYDGQVKVVDFGIAKARGRSTETREGTIKGKVRFMAPEQITGHDIDRRADLFAIGVLLYDALAGQRLWDGVDAEVGIIQRLMAGDFARSPRATNPEVPEALDEICFKALAQKKEERYATADEFRAELERWLVDTNQLAEARQGLTTLMTTLFEEKREEIRRVIEAQMARDGDSAAPLPSLRLDALTTSSASNPSMSRELSQASSGQMYTGASQVTSASAVTPVGRNFKLAIGASVVAAAVAGIFAARRGAPPAQPVAAPTAAVVAATNPATAAAPGRVKVALRVDPPQSVISIDGVSYSPPYEATVARDMVPHRLIISANGYSTIEEVLFLSTDVERAFVLHPVPAAASAPPTTPAPAGDTRRIAVKGGPAPTPAKPPAAGPTTVVAPPTTASPEPTAPAAAPSAAVPRGRKHVVDSNNPYATPGTND